MSRALLATATILSLAVLYLCSPVLCVLAVALWGAAYLKF